VLATDITTASGRAEALKSLRSATPDHPVTLVTTRADEMSGVQGARTATTTVSRVTITAVNTGIPRETHLESTTLTTIEATGLDTTGVEFGGRSTWLAPESGFYETETSDSGPVRWTDGHGRISIRIDGNSSPSSLAMSIADTGLEGTDLLVMVNGMELFNGTVPAGSWSAVYELAGVADLRPGMTAELDIVSATFWPAAGSGVQAERPYGVQVQSLVLSDGE